MNRTIGHVTEARDRHSDDDDDGLGKQQLEVGRRKGRATFR
jgi:hypothetical protein